MKKNRLDIGLCVLSGLCLTFAYPRINFSFLAWGALIPLFWVLGRVSSRRQAVNCTALTGAVFFFFSLSWLRFVTFGGWLAVVLFETAFFFLLGFLFYESLKFKNLAARVVLLSLSWMIVEILRSEFPVFGLGWNLIAYSQASFLPVIQFASILGSYGLGFLIAAVNALIYEGLRIAFLEKNIKRAVFAWFAAIIIAGGLIGGGSVRLREDLSSRDSIRVSLIQGNIPQSVKWELMAREQIIQIYSKLTELASYDVPHLILWPEASFPGYFNLDQERTLIEELIRKIETPVMIGAPYLESHERAYNSAYFLGADGLEQRRYDKLMLVPFGEYVPLGPLTGWLQPIAETLGVSDFSAGREKTVFELKKPEVLFSVLICFEDVFPRLARSFADKDIRFLAVMTNDAWFGASGAPYQHLQASVFRAVENGLPVVRAANTGVSAVISEYGEVLGRVEREGRDIFISGHKTLSVPLGGSETTFYRQAGWRIPYAAALAGMLFFVFRFLRRCQKTKKEAL